MTNRKMYDSVNIDNLPLDGDVYAGYVGGNWPTYEPLMKKFPHKPVVSIAVQANQDAQVLDIESGDATPEQAAAWVARQIKLGRKRPTIYTSHALMQDVLNEIAKAKVERPDFWIADWTGAAHAIPGAVAVQWASNDRFDETVITDPTWPEVASAPKPAPKPEPKPEPKPDNEPVLKPGDKGAEVKELQTKLKVKVDGIFGPVTEAAVKKFQTEHKIKVDGIVGPQTWKALGM